MTDNISKIEFITILDKEGTPGLNLNGGSYDFIRILARRGNEIFGIYFDTSAEFDYCSKCGTFTRHDDYPGDKCNHDFHYPSAEIHPDDNILAVLKQGDNNWDFWMDKLSRGQFSTRVIR